MKATTTVTLLDEAQCLELEAVLVDRIYEFNSEATGYTDGKLIGGSVRSDTGELIGGFNGHTWGGTCVITNLWVSGANRGEGLGRLLLHSAEAEARQRSCTQMILTTHSFQAPAFYERMGYEAVSSIADWPRGYANIVYRKVLRGASAD